MRLKVYRRASVALFAFCSAAHATTFTFNSNPFAGSTALATPGRQIVPNEAFINFDVSQDVFALDPTVFLTAGTVNFVNAPAANLSLGGVNIVMLQTFDNDNNLATPFGAGNAADLIASHITTTGPGFFIYFNQALNVPRLVYSTDLRSNSPDLKVLPRLINLTGDTGRNAIPTFTAANFEMTTAPEPASFAMLGVGLLGMGCLARRPRSEA